MTRTCQLAHRSSYICILSITICMCTLTHTLLQSIPIQCKDLFTTHCRETCLHVFNVYHSCMFPSASANLYPMLPVLFLCTSFRVKSCDITNVGVVQTQPSLLSTNPSCGELTALRALSVLFHRYPPSLNTCSPSMSPTMLLVGVPPAMWWTLSLLLGCGHS